MWKQRDLSFIGRVQIIKALYSLFQYSISAEDIPETYIKEVIYALFLWKDKKKRGFDKK